MEETISQFLFYLKRKKGGGVTLKPIFHWKLGLGWLIFALPMRKKVHKQHEIYMANAGPSRWGPNTTYIPLARIGILRWG